jgi:hypothetical protein
MKLALVTALIDACEDGFLDTIVTSAQENLVQAVGGRMTKSSVQLPDFVFSQVAIGYRGLTVAEEQPRMSPFANDGVVFAVVDQHVSDVVEINVERIVWAGFFAVRTIVYIYVFNVG